MKLLDLNELASSDYILVTLMVMGKHVIGLNAIDKIFLKALKDTTLLSKHVDKLTEASILALQVDTPAVEQLLQSSGIQLGEERTIHIVLAAIPTLLLDVSKLRELLEKAFGDFYNSVTAWYCKEEELRDMAREYLLYISTFLYKEDEATIRKPKIEYISQKFVKFDKESLQPAVISLE